jgi:hypothetical protein
MVVEGLGALWIDREKFIAVILSPRIHTSLYSIHDSQPLRVSEDSIFEWPLHRGGDTLVWDHRAGRAGWWLTRTGPGSSPSRMQILSSEYIFSAWPSPSLRYLLYLKGNGEAWRISLPDGRQKRLPEILDGLNPFGGRIRPSYDDMRIVFAKGRLDARLVLIENLFE